MAGEKRPWQTPEANGSANYNEGTRRTDKTARQKSDLLRCSRIIETLAELAASPLLRFPRGVRGFIYDFATTPFTRSRVRCDKPNLERMLGRTARRFRH